MTAFEEISCVVRQMCASGACVGLAEVQLFSTALPDKKNSNAISIGPPFTLKLKVRHIHHSMSRSSFLLIVSVVDQQSVSYTAGWATEGYCGGEYRRR